MKNKRPPWPWELEGFRRIVDSEVQKYRRELQTRTYTVNSATFVVYEWRVAA